MLLTEVLAVVHGVEALLAHRQVSQGLLLLDDIERQFRDLDGQVTETSNALWIPG